MDNLHLHYEIRAAGYKTPCWIWQKYVRYDGYGQFRRFNKTQYAHVVFYIRAKGKIPVGYKLDHLCKNRNCVNPDHLEAVTNTVNTIRGARAKLTTEKVIEIRERWASGEYTQTSLGHLYGVNPCQISRLVRNETWLTAKEEESVCQEG
jgi:hypothetical protein